MSESISISNYHHSIPLLLPTLQHIQSYDSDINLSFGSKKYSNSHSHIPGFRDEQKRNSISFLLNNKDTCLLQISNNYKYHQANDPSAKYFFILEKYGNSFSTLNWGVTDTNKKLRSTPPHTETQNASISSSSSYSHLQTLHRPCPIPRILTVPRMTIKLPAKCPPLSLEKPYEMKIQSKKRQRVGTSCNCCRGKKPRCNGQIEVLYQHNSVISSFITKLHHVLTQKDILKCNDEFLNTLNITTDILNGSSSKLLVKHFDKIIIFEPCTSCHKKGRESKCRRNSSNRNILTQCMFSKGFTKSDVIMFRRIQSTLLISSKEKTIFELKVSDYKRSRRQ